MNIKKSLLTFVTFATCSFSLQAANDFSVEKQDFLNELGNKFKNYTYELYNKQQDTMAPSLKTLKEQLGKKTSSETLEEITPGIEALPHLLMVHFRSANVVNGNEAMRFLGGKLDEILGGISSINHSSVFGESLINIQQNNDQNLTPISLTDQPEKDHEEEKLMISMVSHNMESNIHNPSDVEPLMIVTTNNKELAQSFKQSQELNFIPEEESAKPIKSQEEELSNKEDDEPSQSEELKVVEEPEVSKEVLQKQQQKTQIIIPEPIELSIDQQKKIEEISVIDESLRDERKSDSDIESEKENSLPIKKKDTAKKLIENHEDSLDLLRHPTQQRKTSAVEKNNGAKRGRGSGRRGRGM